MSHDIFNIDLEDRDRPFSTDPGRSVEENTRFIDYRQYYLDKGYPFEKAEQYAWDHIYTERKLETKV